MMEIDRSATGISTIRMYDEEDEDDDVDFDNDSAMKIYDNSMLQMGGRERVCSKDGLVNDKWTRITENMEYNLVRCQSMMAHQFQSEALLLTELIPAMFEDVAIKKWKSSRFTNILTISQPTYSKPRVKEFGSEWTHSLYPSEAEWRNMSYMVHLSCTWTLKQFADPSPADVISYNKAMNAINSKLSTDECISDSSLTESLLTMKDELVAMEPKPQLVRFEQCTASPGDLHCLVGGIACQTYKTPGVLNENPNGHGGYFICEGNEKTVVCKFAQKCNYAHVFFNSSQKESDVNYIQCNYKPINRLQKVLSAFHIYMTIVHIDESRRRSEEFMKMQKLDKTQVSHPGAKRYHDLQDSMKKSAAAAADTNGDGRLEELSFDTSQFDFSPSIVIDNDELNDDDDDNRNIRQQQPDVYHINLQEILTISLNNIPMFNFLVTQFLFLIGVDSRDEMLKLICPWVRISPHYEMKENANNNNSSSDGNNKKRSAKSKNSWRNYTHPVEILIADTVEKFISAQCVVGSVRLKSFLPKNHPLRSEGGRLHKGGIPHVIEQSVVKALLSHKPIQNLIQDVRNEFFHFGSKFEATMDMDVCIDGVPRCLAIVMLTLAMMGKRHLEDDFEIRGGIKTNSTRQYPTTPSVTSNYGSIASANAVTKTLWQESLENIKKSLLDEFLPNVGTTMNDDTVFGKQKIVCASIRKVIMVYLKLCPADDMDDVGNRRAETVGTLLKPLYYSNLLLNWRQLQSSISNHTEQEDGFLLKALIQKQFKTSPLQKCIATGEFTSPYMAVGQKNKKTGVTQDRKHVGEAAMLEADRKITPNVCQNSNTSVLQQMHGTQNKFLCRTHTQTDAKAGHDLYLAVSTLVRQGYIIEHIEQLVTGDDIHGVISLHDFSRMYDKCFERDAVEVRIHGIIIGYTFNPHWTLQQLRLSRQCCYIPFDVSIYWENGPSYVGGPLLKPSLTYIELLTDGGAYVRPVYNVENLHKLNRIVEEIETHCFTTVEARMRLVNEGVIVYMDHAEEFNSLICESLAVLDKEEGHWFDSPQVNSDINSDFLYNHPESLFSNCLPEIADNPFRRNFTSHLDKYECGSEIWDEIYYGNNIGENDHKNTHYRIKQNISQIANSPSSYKLSEHASFSYNLPFAFRHAAPNSKAPYTHCDISGEMGVGVIAGFIPLISHTNGVRTTFSSGMKAQHACNAPINIEYQPKIAPLTLLTPKFTVTPTPISKVLNPLMETLSETTPKLVAIKCDPFNAEDGIVHIRPDYGQSYCLNNFTVKATIHNGSNVKKKTMVDQSVLCRPSSFFCNGMRASSYSALNSSIISGQYRGDDNDSKEAQQQQQQHQQQQPSSNVLTLSKNFASSSLDSIVSSADSDGKTAAPVSEEGEDAAARTSTKASLCPGTPRVGSIIQPNEAVIGQVVLKTSMPITSEDIANAIKAEITAAQFEKSRLRLLLKSKKTNRGKSTLNVSVSAPSPPTSDYDLDNLTEDEINYIVLAVNTDAAHYKYWSFDNSKRNDTAFTQRVTQVVFTTNAAGSRVVVVHLQALRVPEVGNKETTHQGQKGVIGIIRPPEDMPFIKCPITGIEIRVELLMNAHSQPSRTTTAQMIEPAYAQMSAGSSGTFKTARSFGSLSNFDIMDILEEHGFKRDGMHTVYDGMTGEACQAEIFLGYIDRAVLDHLSADKFKSRGITGTVDIQTHQPVDGNKSGEMEVQNFFNHGAGDMTNQNLLTASDPVLIPMCGKCGLIASPPSFVDEQGVSRLQSQRYAQKDFMMHQMIKKGRASDVIHPETFSPHDESSGREGIAKKSPNNNVSFQRRGFCNVCSTSEFVRSVLMSYNIYKIMFKLYAEGVAWRLILSNVSPSSSLGGLSGVSPDSNASNFSVLTGLQSRRGVSDGTTKSQQQSTIQSIVQEEEDVGAIVVKTNSEVDEGGEDEGGGDQFTPFGDVSSWLSKLGLESKESSSKMTQWIDADGNQIEYYRAPDSPAYEPFCPDSPAYDPYVDYAPAADNAYEDETVAQKQEVEDGVVDTIPMNDLRALLSTNEQGEALPYEQQGYDPESPAWTPTSPNRFDIAHYDPESPAWSPSSPSSRH